MINITEDIKIEALKHTDKRIQFEYNRFGLNLEQRKSMILIGTIGELIFKKFLELNNIPFSFEYQAGKYDSYDFKVDSKIIEIKTSGFSKDWKKLNLLFCEPQYERGIHKHYHYCIQIFIDGYDIENKTIYLEDCNRAYIVGGINYKNIKKFPCEQSTFTGVYKIPLKHLIPVKDILDLKCEKNEKKTLRENINDFME